MEENNEHEERKQPAPIDCAVLSEKRIPHPERGEYEHDHAVLLAVPIEANVEDVARRLAKDGCGVTITDDFAFVPSLGRCQIISARYRCQNVEAN